MEIPEGLPVRWQSIRERIWPKFKQYSPMLVPIRKLWNKGNRKWIKAITRPFVRCPFDRKIMTSLRWEHLPGGIPWPRL